MTLRSLVGVGCAAMAASAFAAEPFTYQGEIRFNGQPAQGTLDVVFALFNEPGAPIALSQVSVPDVPVVDGRISVIVDFPDDDLFDGSTQYLELRVRDGSTNNQFAILSPRQPVTVAPQAGFARVAQTSLDQPWTLGPSALQFGDGTDAVTINSDQPVGSGAKLTVGFDEDAFGGVYVVGPTLLTGRPVYGYAGGGTTNAYHYFDNATREWSLFTRRTTGAILPGLTLNANGELIAESFKYPAPEVRTEIIQPQDWVFGRQEGLIYDIGTSVVSLLYEGDPMITVTGTLLRASVPLPDGAVMRSMWIVLEDTDPSGDMFDKRLELLRYNAITGFVSSITSLVTPNPTGGFTQYSIPINDPTPFDSSSEFLVLRFQGTVSGEFFDTGVSIRSVGVEYEAAGPR